MVLLELQWETHAKYIGKAQLNLLAVREQVTPILAGQSGKQTIVRN